MTRRARKAALLVLLIVGLVAGEVALEYVREAVEHSGPPIYWAGTVLLASGFLLGLSRAYGMPHRWIGVVLIGDACVAAVICLLVRTLPSTASPDQSIAFVYSVVSAPAWLLAGVLSLVGDPSRDARQPKE